MSVDEKTRNGGEIPDECSVCGETNDPTDRPWRCNHCGKPFGSKVGGSQ